MSERLFFWTCNFTGLVFGWIEMIMTRQDKDQIRQKGLYRLK